MREIKFRAWTWDKMRECGVNGWYAVIDFWQSKAPLMQYTWLKDKNWKEIYEGDYINIYWIYLWWVDGRKTVTRKWIVERNEDELSFAIDWKNIMEHSRWCALEIIGNIYENTDLLPNTNKDD